MKANQLPSANGIPMPLIMNYTPYTRIEEESADVTPVYDEIKQIAYSMGRTVGTKCLKNESTRYKTGHGNSIGIKSDKKNAIDDSKTVK